MNKYIADLHLDHKRVLTFEHDDYITSEDMRRKIKTYWNSGVTGEDHVWLIGDVSFEGEHDTHEFMRELNGHKHLILSSHDAHCLKDWTDVFQSVDFHAVVEDQLGEDNVTVALCHYPIESWTGKFQGNIHIHGHIHAYEFDISHMPNRYNAYCLSMNFIPRPLGWFVEQYGYYPDFYRKIAESAEAQTALLEELQISGPVGGFLI